ncbi:MAG: hypothetical protein DMG32_02065 [Acidobacteria bacterium]|nr:MAG: hypothetical protein DMG32_02065 [Acidobacteriota bacterium]
MVRTNRQTEFVIPQPDYKTRFKTAKTIAHFAVPIFDPAQIWAKQLFSIRDTANLFASRDFSPDVGDEAFGGTYYKQSLITRNPCGACQSPFSPKG